MEQDQTVKKLNNVEKSIEEKQIKTKIENIKGNKGGSGTTLPVNTRQEDDQPRTSRSGDKDIGNKDETSSGKVGGSEINKCGKIKEWADQFTDQLVEDI